jgi:tetratricopeptide (TPR) repeat protein
LADYTTAIQIDPKYADAYINRGNTYKQLKDYTNAFSDFQYALTLSPHNPLYLIHISICCDELGEANLSAESSAKCEQSLSSKDPAQIQADFGLSESNMDFIRSNLSRLKAKLKK